MAVISESTSQAASKMAEEMRVEDLHLLEDPSQELLVKLIQSSLEILASKPKNGPSSSSSSLAVKSHRSESLWAKMVELKVSLTYSSLPLTVRRKLWS